MALELKNVSDIINKSAIKNGIDAEGAETMFNNVSKPTNSDAEITKLLTDLGIRSPTEIMPDEKHWSTTAGAEKQWSAPAAEYSLFPQKPELSKERRILDSVIGNLRHDIEPERVIETVDTFEKKRRGLEDIEALKSTLREDGIDDSTYCTPTVRSSLQDIETTKDILWERSSRSRFSTIGNEIMVLAAGMIGTVFNGERKIPVLGILDYRDYDQTVRCKLRKMRFDTANAVSTVISSNKMGVWTRLALELFPSFIAYPRVKKHNDSIKGLDAKEIQQSLLTISEEENKKLFNNINKV